MPANGEALVQSTVVQAIVPGEPCVVFDVGANIGDWTEQLLRETPADRLPQLQVFAFEPQRGTYRILSEKISRNGWGEVVVPVQLALSNVSGTARMFVVSEGAGRNSLTSRTEDCSTIEEVPVITGEAFFEQAGINRIHLLKCDAEGHDLNVLLGCRSLFERQLIDVAQFEYNQRWIAGRAFLKDAFDIAGEFGYALGKVTPKAVEFYASWDYELETFREGNYLLVRAGLTNRFPSVRWWNAT